MTKLLDNIKLTHIADDDLRATVQLFIDKGVITEQEIVTATVARELALGSTAASGSSSNGSGSAAGSEGNGEQGSSTADRSTKSGGRGRGRKSRTSAAAAVAAGQGNGGARRSAGAGNGAGRGDAKKAAGNGTAGSNSAGSNSASRALQGKYLAAIRRVPKTKRGAFSAIAKAQSREAAIRAINAQYPA